MSMVLEYYYQSCYRVIGSRRKTGLKRVVGEGRGKGGTIGGKQGLDAVTSKEPVGRRKFLSLFHTQQKNGKYR
jgi:hypothetical protein